MTTLAHNKAARALLLPAALCLLPLPLLWGLGLPRYLLLDDIAQQAALQVGLVTGSLAGLITLGVAAGRLRRGLEATFTSLIARDATLAVLALALVGWWFHRREGRVPYFESVSLLCLEAASGLELCVLLYLITRHRQSVLGLSGRRVGLPGVRMVFALSAAELGFFAAVVLGIGTTGRAAGVLEAQRARHLASVADLLARALDEVSARRALTHHPTALESARQLESRLLGLLANELDTSAEILAAEEQPRFDAPIQAMVAHSTYRVVLVDGARVFLVSRHLSDGRRLWLRTAANVRPPVRAPDDATSMIILGLLALGAPLAALVLAQDLRAQVLGVARDLAVMGPRARAGIDSPAGVPVATNDEVGDLALALGEICRRYTEDNERLAHALASAAADDRARSRFLAAASHELRTPLTSIRGYCHLLQRGEPLTDAQREDIALIETSSGQLLTHIDEILDLSRIEAGQEAPLRLSSVDLGALAHSVVQGRTGTVPPAVTLNVSVTPGTPTAWGDPQRLRQILENLVSNALKFTAEGFVQVSVGPGELNGRPAVHVVVADSGPGIPAAEQEAIFTEFHRVEDQRAVVGTGLGLTIARRLATDHRGQLTVESALGKGSAFHLSIPSTPLEDP